MYFLFNRTTLQVFVTYLTGAVYVHLLWFYKHQHDNRVRSTQNAFSLPFAAILVNCAPRGEMHNYCTPHIIKENRISWSIGATTYCYLKCIVYDKLLKLPTIIFNNLVLRTGLLGLCTSLLQPVLQRTQRFELQSLSIIRWRKLTTRRSIMQCKPSTVCSQLSPRYTASRYARTRIDMDMSYTRVLHIKVAYRVPHKWRHAFYRPTCSLAVPNFAVRVSGVFAYVVASGDKSWNY
jgi:hypothetical protein